MNLYDVEQLNELHRRMLSELYARERIAPQRTSPGRLRFGAHRLAAALLALARWLDRRSGVTLSTVGSSDATALSLGPSGPA